MGGVSAVDGAGTAVVVVGVAIRRGDRVLAARRTSPPELAGRWELPGGKPLPGEDLAAAAEREVAEELGCRVRVDGVLPGEVEVRPGLVLRVVTARLEPPVGSGVDAGGGAGTEPLPLEHDALRWLAPDQLGEVDWLEADRPFVAALGRGTQS
ncbi:8-oxo-dGTP diphosphatase [Nocardioides scoriae]|uniref:8-oxo-dGTP diphosphatase n=1 Tax=Nocardioides scoriae TaxID=642780 RepID=A0A1H1SJ52_9ACTN|nr:NUDIX domain-containing protein [Nocardioides scoriae]SDS47982.1 8-oxo-dGTP diphosphatase [Nocardioides scoriae]